MGFEEGNEKHIAASCVIDSFHDFIGNRNLDFESVGSEDSPIPAFPRALVQDLLVDAEKVLSQLPNVVNLEGGIYVVGDLHGNIRDLLRILATAEPPPVSRFLFLGDYVDRGEYSVEVIILLLAMVVIYPNYITLLRGNHEYEVVNSTYGFKEQVYALYGNTGLYESFNQTFSYMPVAALIDDTTFCVHGGLSPKLKRIDQLNDFDRTLTPPCELMNDIVWSDPSNVTESCIQSTRGNGCLFGHTFLHNFLVNNKLKRLVRAHECVKNGVRVGKDSKIVTVFSTCNYKGEGSNQCGIIKVIEDGSFQAFNLKLIKVLRRVNANFSKIAYRGKSTSIVLGSLPSATNLLSTLRLIARGGIVGSRSMIRKKTIGNLRNLNSSCLIVKPDLPDESTKRRWTLGANSLSDILAASEASNISTSCSLCAYETPLSSSFIIPQ
ncbi:Ser/Thr protein phosphatase [Tritrichomonas foetus]|uniref:Serine/threonine-protein phosphatase n=1 Tax=Tritrichomonas foetus TaxID=1144522 RepID=A0A1J4JPH9_9EUKA|nr:Ser/Thr protein phosphatase [Tritrichomonas foetus]|eukprot:OHT00650.1 Ser/Thr protein phosphatase [Tritrichomonas foetus]